MDSLVFRFLILTSPPGYCSSQFRALLGRMRKEDCWGRERSAREIFAGRSLASPAWLATLEWDERKWQRGNAAILELWVTERLNGKRTSILWWCEMRSGHEELGRHFNTACAKDPLEEENALVRLQFIHLTHSQRKEPS